MIQNSKLEIQNFHKKGGEYEIMRKAFTLIELLIVIAIIGILAGILFVSIGQNPLIKSRDSKRTADMQNLRTALTLYYTDNARYPATAEFGTGGTLPLVPKYVPALPNDPSDNLDATLCASYTPTFGGTTLAAGYRAYSYTVSSDNQRYVLTACLEKDDNKILATDCDDVASTPACHTDSNGVATAGTALFDIAS